MKLAKSLIIAILASAGVEAYASSVSIVGSEKQVCAEKPDASTGLNSFFVVYDTNGVSMEYEADGDASTVHWYRFGSAGGGYAEEIISGIASSGTKSVLEQVSPNSGYIIEDGTNRTYIWVVNYADFYPSQMSLSVSPDSDCGQVMLNITGNAGEMAYYTINGQRKIINREIALTYNTLQWSDEQKGYVSEEVIKNMESLRETVALPAPLCNTAFSLSCDKYLKVWGEEISCESELYTAMAVEVKGIATRTNAEAGSTELGGSAPADVEFAGYVTDAVVHKEWQIASDEEFENILQRYNEQTLDYTFNEAGSFYVRFFGADASGKCEAYSDVFTVKIGESSLRCPNAFSPDASEGINDVWRVKSKSIVEFECHIFNRWGIEIFSFTNPAEGWDGKYKGKYVGPGVYFYVIKAKGADGRDYKLKGDINIVGYKKNGTTSTTE